MHVPRKFISLFRRVREWGKEGLFNPKTADHQKSPSRAQSVSSAGFSKSAELRGAAGSCSEGGSSSHG